ncbi:MAG: hypothetical protein M3441_13080 [Chloroflexota bacterium]|nr:hypothetical protein [Chloroflexota bacterium]
MGFIVILVVGGVFLAINQALRSISNDSKLGNGTRPMYSRRKQLQGSEEP